MSKLLKQHPGCVFGHARDVEVCGLLGTTASKTLPMFSMQRTPSGATRPSCLEAWSVLSTFPTMRPVIGRTKCLMPISVADRMKFTYGQDWDLCTACRAKAAFFQILKSDTCAVCFPGGLSMRSMA